MILDNTLELVLDARNNGGGTYRVQYDRFITIDEVVEYGYLVSEKLGIENLPSECLSIYLVDAFILAKNLDIPSYRYLGLWQDEETGLWSIDVSCWYPYKVDAGIVGYANKQKAIWDVANEVAISLD